MTMIMTAPQRGRLEKGRPGMVWVSGGGFVMGSDHHYPEEAPAHRMTVDGFWIDSRPVTNRQFSRFVHATCWITVAERPADTARHPGAAPEMLRPSSLVFAPPPQGRPARDVGDWWAYVRGADWRHPYGPDSNLSGLDDHPVVHVAWEDVCAYADWAGVALPTEAEWEYAARGGLDRATYAWGEQFTPGGRHMANVWQGEFPYENLEKDGWARTSPVGAFPPNGYGLYDMIGNVWEWTQDWWATAALKARTGCCSADKPLDREALSYDPAAEALKIPRKVLKGGSHLCAPNYCRRYRPAARSPHPVDTSASHVGFRCIVRPRAGG